MIVGYKLDIYPSLLIGTHSCFFLLLSECEGQADLLSCGCRSLPNGLLPDNVWVGVCGTIAAVAGLKGQWKRTA